MFMTGMSVLTNANQVKGWMPPPRAGTFETTRESQAAKAAARE